MKQILFVNGSPNRNGNTVEMAHRLLSGKGYETLHLVDYKIYPLGQSFAHCILSITRFILWGNLLLTTSLMKSCKKITVADILVMGSPVYWHSMTGQFRTLFDRIYESPYKHQLRGKALYFIFQGAAPSSAMLEAGNYTMGIFCRLFGLDYKGMATNTREAERLGTNLLK